jgi:hypothetical protein
MHQKLYQDKPWLLIIIIHAVQVDIIIHAVQVDIIIHAVQVDIIIHAVQVDIIIHAVQVDIIIHAVQVDILIHAVQVDILLACRKHLHDCIISFKGEVWISKTSLTHYFVYLHVCTKPGKWVVIYLC